MKMTKKVLVAALAAIVSLTFVGCPKMGDVHTSGTKNDKKFWIDATGELKDGNGKVLTGDKQYARGFAALSASKHCSAIEETITLAKADNIVTANGKNAVVGLAFDVHETTKDGKKYYDFVLVGVKPADGQFYVEKYENISKDNLKETMNTTDGAIDGAELATESNTNDARYKGLEPDTYTKSNFVTSGAKVAVEETEESYSWTITVTQETAGTFVVKNGNTLLGTYTRPLTTVETADTQHDGKAYGQVFMYVNAPQGTKIKANFKANTDKTVGLFADEDEF